MRFRPTAQFFSPSSSSMPFAIARHADQIGHARFGRQRNDFLQFGDQFVVVLFAD
jgi:hypothetical protein